MKFTTLSTICLAAGITLAAPTTPSSEESTTLQPIFIDSWTAKLLSKVPQGTMTFNMGDPNNKDVVKTNCTVYWQRGITFPDNKMVKCHNAAYEFGFPKGIDSIDDFTLKVARTDGAWSAQYAANSKNENWNCNEYTQGDFKEKCDLIGTMNLDVTPPSSS
ncbi:uncharacterized protein PFLUO_LOCUS1746 [Penicillium psychrofluorescens]|uniref:uncharacterized protein n=1 Tax=Penicillium psychrofluorescens TaxID=3158075 RepID=UPI003CCD5816